jgi:hypothetical protein
MEQFLKVADCCGDGRAYLQANSFLVQIPDIEQVLKSTGFFQDPEGVRFQDC